jgi:hypothetical protein
MSPKTESPISGKLLVALDMTYMDDLLIRYAAFLKSQFPIKEIVLYHNIKLVDPEKLAGVLDSLDEPLDDILRKKIKETAEDILSEKEYSIHISQSDDTMESMLDYLEKEKIKNALFGKKLNYEGSGYLIERLIGESPDINILAFPENAYFDHGQILIPTDFSKKSALTITKALAANKSLQGDLQFIHVYTVPNIYFPFIPTKDLKRDMKKEASEDWNKFKRRYFKDVNLGEIDFSFDAEKSFAEIIYNYAVTNQVNLIILPNKQSFMNNLIVQVLRKDMHIPLFFLDS